MGGGQTGDKNIFWGKCPPPFPPLVLHWQLIHMECYIYKCHLHLFWGLILFFTPQKKIIKRSNHITKQNKDLLKKSQGIQCYMLQTANLQFVKEKSSSQI